MLEYSKLRQQSHSNLAGSSMQCGGCYHHHNDDDDHHHHHHHHHCQHQGHVMAIATIITIIISIICKLFPRMWT